MATEDVDDTWSARALDVDRPDADAAHGVLAYLAVHRLDEPLPVEDRSPGAAGSLSYHGHCTQQALGTDHHAVGVLRRVGYDVDPLATTRCGMAGSFGYHDRSKAIAGLLYDAVDESGADRVVAPGGSCRSQLADRDGAEDLPPHPIEAVADRL